jgi:hypothetical protein
MADEINEQAESAERRRHKFPHAARLQAIGEWDRNIKSVGDDLLRLTPPDAPTTARMWLKWAGSKPNGKAVHDRLIDHLTALRELPPELEDVPPDRVKPLVPSLDDPITRDESEEDPPPAPRPPFPTQRFLDGCIGRVRKGDVGAAREFVGVLPRFTRHKALLVVLGRFAATARKPTRAAGRPRVNADRDAEIVRRWNEDEEATEASVAAAVSALDRWGRLTRNMVKGALRQARKAGEVVRPG